MNVGSIDLVVRSYCCQSFLQHQKRSRFHIFIEMKILDIAWQSGTQVDTRRGEKQTIHASDKGDGDKSSYRSSIQCMLLLQTNYKECEKIEHNMHCERFIFGTIYTIVECIITTKLVWERSVVRPSWGL